MPGSSFSRAQGYPKDGRHRWMHEWITRGDQASVSEARHFSVRGSSYTLRCTLSKVKNAESTQHSISINFYRYQVPSCKSLIFLYIIFWPGGLLVFYDLFLIKDWSARTPEQWCSLEVFPLKFLACITLKVQSYIFMEQRFSRLQQRKNLLTQSLMLLMLRLLLVFSTSWLYALPGTQWIRDVRTWQQALHRLNNVARVWIKLPCKLEC